MGKGKYATTSNTPREIPTVWSRERREEDARLLRTFDFERILPNDPSLSEIKWQDPGLSEVVANRIITAIKEKKFKEIETMVLFLRRSGENNLSRVVARAFSDQPFRNRLLFAIRETVNSFSPEDKKQIVDLLELNHGEEQVAFARIE